MANATIFDIGSPPYSRDDGLCTQTSRIRVTRTKSATAGLKFLRDSTPEISLMLSMIDLAMSLVDLFTNQPTSPLWSAIDILSNLLT